MKAGLAKHAAEFTQKIATLEKQSSEATGKLTQRTITDAVKDAAQAEHMRPEAIAHAITLGNLEVKLDETGTPKTKGSGDVASFIDGLKASAPFLLWHRPKEREHVAAAMARRSMRAAILGRPCLQFEGVSPDHQRRTLSLRHGLAHTASQRA